MTLPAGITITKPSHSRWFCYTVARSGQMIWSDRVTPEDLEAIARHMREGNETEEVPHRAFGITHEGE